MWFALIWGSSPLLWWLTHTFNSCSLSQGLKYNTWLQLRAVSQSQCLTQFAVARGDNELGSHHFVSSRIYNFNVLDCGTSQVKRVLDTVNQMFWDAFKQSVHLTSLTTSGCSFKSSSEILRPLALTEMDSSSAPIWEPQKPSTWPDIGVLTCSLKMLQLTDHKPFYSGGHPSLFLECSQQHLLWQDCIMIIAKLH